MSEDYTAALESKILNTTIRCLNCNFCYSVCPIYQSMPSFASNGPSGIIQGLFYAVKWGMLDKKENLDELVNLLYNCTTCKSCVLTCKGAGTDTPILELIEAGRSLVVDKGLAPLANQAEALKSIFLKGNPYDKDPMQRLSWLEDSDIKQLPEQKAEILYYIGCTPAYDPELRHLAKSIIDILQALKVDFGILKEEICCACLANRMGDEFLFEEVSNKNVNAFSHNNTKDAKIITTSPHCYNTYLNEYEQSLNVQHYTQFLAEFIKNKHVELKKLDCVVTYHDPCYLTKHNEVYEEPRALITAIPGVKLVEMEKNKANSLCCGGGGGLMWEEMQQEERLANIRVEQALSTGASLLITSCPWCYTMFRDAIKDLGQEDKLKVKDLGELFLEALK